MPGPPRNPGCYICKARKIKCDESWPSCTPCRRSNRDCPGPTPLVNAAYISPHTSAQSSAGAGIPVRPGRRLTAVASTKAKTNPNARVKLNPPSSADLRQANKLKAEGGLLTISNCQQPLCPGTPRSHPKTRPDQLASYLAAVLNNGVYQGDLAQLDILSFIPQRLHSSECLCDSVTFWCHLQLDTRRTLPKPSVATLHYYSKALQSLQRTLESKDAYRTETLAAAVLLQRTTPTFHNTVKSDSVAHAKGISALVVHRGPPASEDDLDISLANELGSMLFCWHSHEPSQHCSSVSEAVSVDSDESEHAEESFSFPEENLIRNTFINLLDCIPTLSSIHDNPESKEAMSLEAVDILRRINDLYSNITQASSRIKARLTKQGSFQVVADPTFFAGQRYHFDSVQVAHVLLRVFILEIITPKILYDLSALYNCPDQDEVWQKYRSGSMQLWMCIPYLATLDLTVAQIISCAFSLTFEAADDTERNFILDAAADYDTYLARLRKDRTLLAERVLRTGRQLTGREELMPIQVWMHNISKAPPRPKSRQSRGASKKLDSGHLLHGCLFFEGLFGPSGG